MVTDMIERDLIETRKPREGVDDAVSLSHVAVDLVLADLYRAPAAPKPGPSAAQS